MINLSTKKIHIAHRPGSWYNKKGDTMKKIKGINRKASKNKRYKRRIGYREFISSIEARKAHQSLSG
jgi:hypothetical protein